MGDDSTCWRKPLRSAARPCRLLACYAARDIVVGIDRNPFRKSGIHQRADALPRQERSCLASVSTGTPIHRLSTLVVIPG